jgi:hypothetical protein
LIQDALDVCSTERWIVEQDADATLALYRANKDFRTLLSAHAEPETDTSRRFVEAVREVMH